MILRPVPDDGRRFEAVTDGTFILPPDHPDYDDLYGQTWFEDDPRCPDGAVELWRLVEQP